MLDILIGYCILLYGSVLFGGIVVGIAMTLEYAADIRRARRRSSLKVRTLDGTMTEDEVRSMWRSLILRGSVAWLFSPLLPVVAVWWAGSKMISGVRLLTRG